jgi:hypothetical protein
MPVQMKTATQVLGAFLMIALAAPALAQRDRDNSRHDRGGDRGSSHSRSAPNQHDRGTRDHSTRSRPRERTSPVRPRRDHRYVLDQRYRHNRYYPRHGTVLRTLPRDHRVYRYHNSRYYFHGGIWYRPYGHRWIVVRPPIGLFISVLPPYYTTIWFGGVPYYYAGGVYYTWLPERHVYVVTQPPSDEAVTAPPGSDSEDLFVYPKQGQSEEQQATDRYQCYSWAKSQTGFDPTVSGGSVPAEQLESRRADYHRAMKACLEARGYSVQ